MKRRKTITRLMVNLVLVLLAAETVVAMGATVGITPDSVTLGIGEKKIVQVVVNVPAPTLGSDPQGLAAFQFTARANPTIL